MKRKICAVPKMKAGAAESSVVTNKSKQVTASVVQGYCGRCKVGFLLGSHRDGFHNINPIKEWENSENIR